MACAVNILLSYFTTVATVACNINILMIVDYTATGMIYNFIGTIQIEVYLTIINLDIKSITMFLVPRH